MSPHQFESYLKAAWFIADRLIFDNRPEQRAREFDIEHSGGLAEATSRQTPRTN